MEHMFDADSPRAASQTSVVLAEPRFRPFYAFAEVARYAKTSPQTASRWLRGYEYPTRHGSRYSGRVAGSGKEGLFTFQDLVEVAAIARARNEGVSMNRLRQAVESAQRIYGWQRPFLHRGFLTDGRELFIREGNTGNHVNLNREGQVAWRLISEMLRSVDYEDDYPHRWWAAGREKHIVVDPRYSFGKPFVHPQVVSTIVLIQRFQAGEGIELLAEDYGLNSAVVEDAIRFEQPTVELAA